MIYKPLNGWKDTANQLNLIDRRWSRDQLENLDHLSHVTGSFRGFQNSLNHSLVTKDFSKGAIDFHHVLYYLRTIHEQIIHKHMIWY